MTTFTSCFRPRLLTLSCLFISLSCFKTTVAEAGATPVEDLALRAGYGSTMVKEFLNKPPYDTTQLQKSAQAQDALMSPSKEEQQAALGNIYSILTNTSISDTAITNAKSIPVPLGKLPAAQASIFSIFAKIDPTLKAKANSTSLDLGNLLIPMLYSTVTSTWGNNQQVTIDQKAAAKNYVTLVTGLANPLQVADLSELDEAKARGQDKVAAYLTSLWTYVAQVSASFGTLNHYYNERLPVSDKDLQPLLNQAGNPPPGSKLKPLPANPSLLQVRQYLATRRVKDTDWYERMKVADPAEVNREHLFIEAEMRSEIFNLQMELERTNSLLAIMVAQNANIGRTQLEQARDSLKQSDALKTPEEKT